MHFHPDAGSGGASWLCFIGQPKDSLWSLDLFRCESAILQSYWVLAVMDQSNTWTKHYSGQEPIWKTSFDSSEIISIDSVCTPAYKDD